MEQPRIADSRDGRIGNRFRCHGRTQSEGFRRRPQRSDLIYLTKAGELVVVRHNGKVTGFAFLRAFGRGEIIGPVVATKLEDAKALASYLLPRRPASFSGSIPPP
ncbi:hypothetical protein [Rhizobium sp. R339]|uniref:hypothetical protein n=1 Tax=Rhizobium sp. R339 TaxID=1764273 RepID=UPI001131CA72|nr:hypothetical protein [Rhizobium sp. R339]